GGFRGVAPPGQHRQGSAPRDDLGRAGISAAASATSANVWAGAPNAPDVEAAGCEDRAASRPDAPAAPNASTPYPFRHRPASTTRTGTAITTGPPMISINTLSAINPSHQEAGARIRRSDRVEAAGSCGFAGIGQVTARCIWS